MQYSAQAFEFAQRTVTAGLCEANSTAKLNEAVTKQNAPQLKGGTALCTGATPLEGWC